MEEEGRQEGVGVLGGVHLGSRQEGRRRIGQGARGAQEEDESVGSS